MSKKHTYTGVIAFLCVFSVIFFSSCGEKTYPTEHIANALVNGCEELSSYVIYSTEYDEKSEAYFTDGLFRLMFGKNEICREKELLYSATAVLSPRPQIREIVIFSLYDESEAADIIKICERRVEKLEKYAKSLDETEKAVVSEAKIIKKGKYVVLLITADNEKYENKIAKFI